jgi:hypothetical protein
MLHHYERGVVTGRLGRGREFVSFPSQIGYGAKPSSYPMDIDVSFSRLRRPEYLAYISLPLVAEVRHMWNNA